MKDAEFKALCHPVGDDIVASRGTEVAQGYKPDITVRSSQGQLKYIIESEQKTDRKAFLGNLVKAEMYAEQQNAQPELLIVMQLFDNTTTKQIADHIRPYAKWLSGLKGGRLNLSAIHVLSDSEYCTAISFGEQLGTPAFKRRGHVIEAALRAVLRS